jgi:hypothetical protein
MTNPLTLRRIGSYWLPLAATWLMMSVEGPLLAAFIARSAEPKLNLAAYGVAFSLALIVEAPIIMMLSASTELVRDGASFRSLRRFAWLLNLAVTGAMGLLLVPPVFEWVAAGLIGLPPEVVWRTRIAVLLLLPWPAAIGYRRFYQGVLIRHGLPRRVALGTVLRLVTMGVTAVALFVWGGLEGAWLGAVSLSVGVVAEGAASRIMARNVIAGLSSGEIAEPGAGPLSWRFMATFYWPLATTSLLALGVHPLITFFIGHSRLALESLAVMPVVLSLLLIFRSFGLAYQEVVIALIGERQQGLGLLRRFAQLLGVGVLLALGLIAWTPLAGLWYGSVSGLSPELARFALVPTRILVVIPALTVLLSWQRSLLVNARQTSPVTWATALEILVAVLVLAVSIHLLDAPGAVAAAVALVIGRVAANLSLVPPLRRLGERTAQ